VGPSAYSALAVPARAPEHGPDAGGQLVEGERFDDVIVDPGFEALYDVLLALPGGEPTYHERKS
jgi:hypothetical protein